MIFDARMTLDRKEIAIGEGQVMMIVNICRLVRNEEVTMQLNIVYTRLIYVTNL
jgi:hypothetical protein